MDTYKLCMLLLPPQSSCDWRMGSSTATTLADSSFDQRFNMFRALEQPSQLSRHLSRSRLAVFMVHWWYGPAATDAGGRSFSAVGMATAALRRQVQQRQRTVLLRKATAHVPVSLSRMLKGCQSG